MNSIEQEKMPLMTRIVDMFLRGDVALLLIGVSLALGAVAMWLTPREEEPQIVVPMADVIVSAPGLSSKEVERQVTSRLEKVLSQIDGVEYLYSTSLPGQCVVTTRFYVGEDREDSLVKLYSKIRSNIDQVPAGVKHWVIKPIEVDDVPIVTVSLWQDRADAYPFHSLRRLGEQLQNELSSLPSIKKNSVHLIGGRPRLIRIGLDPTRLAARGTAPLDVVHALQVSNVNIRAGAFEKGNTEATVEAGTYFRNARDIRNLVIRVVDDRPVYLRDVAEVTDGPAEVEGYSWFGFGPASKEGKAGSVHPAVSITVAKQKGSNAVWVADAVSDRMELLAKNLLPDGVHYKITRNYGETANDKVDELIEGLAIAVLTVIGLIGLVLGWRPALVIALAIPVCYSLTLFVNLLAGYTINRVTMFALILSLGLLVDDPITDVENIARYFAMRILPPRASVLRAIQEVRPALILSTLAIIVSFLPLMFITGMMGPYMGPMAMNVPLTVSLSTVVAFLVTPWLAMVAMRKLAYGKSAGKQEDGQESTGEFSGEGEGGFDLQKRPIYRFFRAVLVPILDRPWLSWLALGGVMLLLVGAMLVPLFRLVPLKMLPYDNKNEFLVIIDMPESATLEQTNATTQEIGAYLSNVAEVRDFEAYVGVASPMDFNGMVRHYFMRNASHLADIRVNLVPKEDRVQQSHNILLRVRNDLTALGNKHGAKIKLVEVPPGPPVLSTIVAEVYGPKRGSYDELIVEARRVAKRVAREPGIVDVDVSASDDRTRWVFEPDKTKAALSGISAENMAKTIRLALSGHRATIMHIPREINPLAIEIRLPRAQRSSVEALAKLFVRGNEGEVVRLGSLGTFVKKKEDQAIYRKNQQRVVYVYAEVAGRPPAEAIIDMQMDRVANPTPEEVKKFRTDTKSSPAVDAKNRTWLTLGGGDLWAVSDPYKVQWAGEGEWKITLDVFRDLGLAFAAAQLGIFVILMFQTGSRLLPLVIMLAIPLTLIGVMPGFWLLNVLVDHPIGGHPTPVFLTATAMIGMIALSGIVVRNSVVLIDFIHYAQSQGIALKEAIIQSVAIRTRPILLTAGTTLLGNWVITLDPIFSGLAWAIIFGILTSTIFTLIVIPVVYWLLYGDKESATET